MGPDDILNFLSAPDEEEEVPVGNWCEAEVHAEEWIPDQGQWAPTAVRAEEWMSYRRGPLQEFRVDNSEFKAKTVGLAYR